MKKKVIVLGLIVGLLFSGCSSETKTETKQSEQKEENKQQEAQVEKIENPDFRNCKWGMTKEEVIENETEIEVILDEGNELYAETTVDGDDFTIAYFFNENKLEQVLLISKEEHSNRNLYIDDYNNLKELFIQKYGTPKQDKEVWKNDLYKNRPDDWGDAIAYGHLGMFSQWFTDTTEVGVMLRGDNYEINLSIIYRDINYEEEIDISEI